jgi:hypothetical protein
MVVRGGGGSPLGQWHVLPFIATGEVHSLDSLIVSGLDYMRSSFPTRPPWVSMEDPNANVAPPLGLSLLVKGVESYLKSCPIAL